MQAALHARARVGVVQRVAAQAVAQGQRGHALQVLGLHRFVALQRGECPGGAQQRELGAQAVGAQLLAQARAQHQHVIAHFHLVQQFTRFEDALLQLLVVLVPQRFEGGGVFVEGVAAFDDAHAQRQVLRRAHLHRQAKAVQQLRAQLAFFGVAAAHQHKAGGVAHAQAFALDQVFARGGHVDQQVHQMVVQQVDLVDVQKAPVRLSQQAGGEGLHTLRQGFFQIERADHAVLGRAQRQVDHGHGLAFGHDFGFGVAGLADRAGACWFGRIAAVRAAFDDRNRGQQIGQRTHGRGFARAPVAQNQHAANGRVDRHHLDGEGHFILTNDGRKREGQCHGAFRKLFSAHDPKDASKCQVKFTLEFRFCGGGWSRCWIRVEFLASSRNAPPNPKRAAAACF